MNFDFRNEKVAMRYFQKEIMQVYEKDEIYIRVKYYPEGDVLFVVRLIEDEDAFETYIKILRQVYKEDNMTLHSQFECKINPNTFHRESFIQDELKKFIIEWNQNPRSF